MSRGTPAQVRATALQELGTTLRDQRRYEEAQHCYDQAMALLAAAVDESHPAVLAVQLDIGLLAFRSGKLDRAEQVLDHVSASLCDVFGTGHRRCGHAHLQLAEVLRSQGRLDQASEHVMHGLAAYQRAYESDHPALAEVHIRLGALLYRRGEYQRALDEYRAAYALEVANKSADHVDAAYAQANVAEALWALGRFDEARAATEQIETALRAGDQWNDPLRAFVLSIRGRSNVELGNDGDAIAMLQAAAQGLDNNADLAIELADVYWAMARALAAGPGPDQSRARDFEQRACQIYREQSREVHIPAEVIGACAQRRADDRE
ncbi:MAG: tetratricopeptide repeat protein [Proteobacteria bacterium]|nr:tetratricopeptide repeat protein [Pseudomonadota bacterium]